MMYLLDTNICIYIMKRKPAEVLIRLKEAWEDGVALSSVTLAELEFGVCHSANPAKNGEALLRFLLPFTVLPFGAEAAAVYGRIRHELQSKGTPIGSMDMLIAAHAKSEGLILVTHNVREFSRVPGLSVENWVES